MKTYNYIYLIRNLINGKIYIGKHSTDNLQDGYMGSGKLLKQSIKKYGIGNFKKELLCMCVDDEELNEMEIYYIQKFNSTDINIGYNLTLGGEGCVPTDEVRKKMSAARQGEKSYWYGKHLADEHKAKLSGANKGKFHKKCKWLTPSGEIVEMHKGNAHRYHPDWKLLED